MDGWRGRCEKISACFENFDLTNLPIYYENLFEPRCRRVDVHIDARSCDRDLRGFVQREF